MSNLVKIVLFVAFAVFAIGFIWAIVTAVKKPNNTAKTDPKPTTSQTTPAPTPAPAPAPQVAAALAPTPPASKPIASSQKRRIVTGRYIIWTEMTSSGDAFANAGNGTWARAGVDANGNAYAEAHAN